MPWLVAVILGVCAPQPLPAPIEFGLKVVRPSETDRSLRWAPQERRFKFGPKVEAPAREELERSLGPLIDPRFGELIVGPPGRDPIPFVVSRTSAGRPWRERFALDANGDGRIDPKREVYTTEAVTENERTIVVHEAVRIQIPYEDATVTHEFSVRIVYPKPEEKGDFDVIRLARRSWMEGTVTIDARRFRVALIDGNNDGRYTRIDFWLIVPDDEAADAAVTGERGLSHPMRACFIGDQAYRLMNVAESASRAGVRLGLEKKPPPEPGASP